MNLTQILHVLLFTSSQPLGIEELTRLTRKGGAQAQLPHFEKVSEKEIEDALLMLRQETDQKSIFLQEIAGGWRYATHAEYAPWVRLLQDQPRATRLSQPALETLAIIAYRQPISRAQIEEVRGVGVGGVLETLIERQLVEVSGRAEIPGRPLLYTTTSLFLEYFGLRDLNELPHAEELHHPTFQNETELQNAQYEVTSQEDKLFKG